MNTGETVKVTNEISEVIRYHRKKSGLTQQQLARMAGVGKTVVFDVEKGKQTIQLSTLLRILKVLNIRLSLDSPLMLQFKRESSERNNA